MKKEARLNKNYMRAFMSRKAHKSFKRQCAEYSEKSNETDALSMVGFFDIISGIDLVSVALKNINNNAVESTYTRTNKLR